MSEDRELTASRVSVRTRAGLLASVALSLIAAATQTSATAGDGWNGGLSPAAVWSHRGVAEVPHRGKVRVRLILGPQPILSAASTSRFRTAVRPSPNHRVRDAALRNRGRISDVEQLAALAAERSYEEAVADLGKATRKTDSDLDRLASQVTARGARVVDRDLVPASLVVRAGSARISVLGRLSTVRSVESAPRPRPLSGVGTVAVGAPAWWSAGYTGGTGSADIVAADAALQSEAADPIHPAFAGVTIDNDPETSVTDHGTHTGGIIASGDTTYRGVAYGVDRLIGSAGAAYALGLDAQGSLGASDPAETINVSFGSSATDDDEGDGDDVLTSVFGVGQAQGAGNDNVDGTPSVANIGRNVLSVGGFNDVGTVTSTDDVVLGFSSRGPTPGGRKKPDLTAPGGSVIAPSASWNSPPSNPDFTGASGTSFSAPHVAGAMTLLEGAGVIDPMAQRAILINSARDWNGMSTGLDDWVPPQASWRPEVGWGELDLESALAERGNYQLGDVRGGEAAFYRATAPTAAKSTLAFEMRGYFVGFPGPGTQTLKYTQSNLDLRQYLADGSEVPPPSDPGQGGGPDAVDPNDTVEQVRAPAGGPQQITYKVEAASTVVGTDAEPFAIAAATPLTMLEAPHVRPVDVGIDPASTVRCGEPVTVTATLANDSGDMDANDATVTLGSPGGVELVTGAATQEVSGGDLEADSTSEPHSWTVEATTDGHKVLVASGEGSGLGTPFTRADEVSLDVDCVPPITAIDSAPNGPTRNPTPIFSFSSEPGSDFECAIDAIPFHACGAPFVPPALEDGNHEFAVRAIDEAGNIDPTPVTSEFVVDTRVTGAGTKLLSRRIDRRERSLGTVSVEMGEPGEVRLTGRAKVGRRSPVSLSSQTRTVNRGRAVIQLRLSKPGFKKIRWGRLSGKRARISVDIRFSDQLGNRHIEKVEFRIR